MNTLYENESPPEIETSDTEYAIRYQRIKADVHQRMVEMLDVSRLSHWPEDRLRYEMRGLASRLLSQSPEALSGDEQEQLADEVIDEAFGLGPLEALLADDSITDILVNGPKDVYIERYGQLERTNIVFADENHLMQVIQRIASRVGRRIDEASPMVDARLPDGSRVNAVVRPLALEGPFLSIRRFGVRLSVDELLDWGSVPSEAMLLLQAAVEARLTVLVSGGTGSGKTTLLNALSRFIPLDERLVTIEDAAELLLQQPHVVRMETRPSNMEGSGEVKQRDLVRNSLRMRPDRIILGEVRGAEALDMLQAMNTGHEGSLTTIHANDTRDALARMEMMVMMAGFELPLQVIRQYIASAITLVVHVSRLKGGARKMTRLSEITGLKDGRYKMRDLFVFTQHGVKNGKAFGSFSATGKKPKCLTKLTAAGLQLPDDLFNRRMLCNTLEEVLPKDPPSDPKFGAVSSSNSSEPIHPHAMLDYLKEHTS